MRAFKHVSWKRRCVRLPVAFESCCVAAVKRQQHRNAHTSAGALSLPPSLSLSLPAPLPLSLSPLPPVSLLRCLCLFPVTLVLGTKGSTCVELGFLPPCSFSSPLQTHGGEITSRGRSNCYHCGSGAYRVHRRRAEGLERRCAPGRYVLQLKRSCFLSHTP